MVKLLLISSCCVNRILTGFLLEATYESYRAAFVIGLLLVYPAIFKENRGLFAFFCKRRPPFPQKLPWGEERAIQIHGLRQFRKPCNVSHGVPSFRVFKKSAKYFFLDPSFFWLMLRSDERRCNTNMAAFTSCEQYFCTVGMCFKPNPFMKDYFQRIFIYCNL